MLLRLLILAGLSLVCALPSPVAAEIGLATFTVLREGDPQAGAQVYAVGLVDACEASPVVSETPLGTTIADGTLLFGMSCGGGGESNGFCGWVFEARWTNPEDPNDLWLDQKEHSLRCLDIVEPALVSLTFNLEQKINLPRRPCCTEKGCFEGFLESSCQGFGKIWYEPFDTCEEGPPCDPDVGACCFQTHCAADQFRSDCALEGGRFFNTGVQCEDVNECRGACCNSNGTCSDVLQADCPAGQFLAFDNSACNLGEDQDLCTCAEDEIDCSGACCRGEGPDDCTEGFIDACQEPDQFLGFRRICELFAGNCRTNCCFLDGDCVENMRTVLCDDDAEGVDISPRKCPNLCVGACTYGGDCNKCEDDVVGKTCVENGGTYHGPFSKCDELSLQESAPCPPPILDHYTQYKIKSSKLRERFASFGPLRLGDAFIDEKFDVLKPQALGTPGAQIIEEVRQPQVHLEDYKLKVPKIPNPPRGVRVLNRCSDVVLDLVKPESLMVPSALSLTDPNLVAPDPDTFLDHYLCWKARRAKQDQSGDKQTSFSKTKSQLQMADAFEDRLYDVKTIKRLCVPVDKGVDPNDPPRFISGPNKGQVKPVVAAFVQRPSDYLLCYSAKRSAKAIPQDPQDSCGCDTSVDERCRGQKLTPAQPKHTRRLGVVLNNQFGPERIDTLGVKEICLPSTVLQTF